MRCQFGKLAAAFVALLAPVSADKLLRSESLNNCQEDSGFSASLFNVVFTPGNASAYFNVVFTSSIQGKVVFDVRIAAYGFEFVREVINPCDMGLRGLCPMVAGKIPFEYILPVSEDAIANIPPIAYNVPDLDATVRVHVNKSDTRESVACVQANVSNERTVDLIGIKWATAIIAGLALISSAIVSGLGHTNAAAHVAANSLSLFGYFQSQAMVGLTGLSLPPIVQAWTQNFQWSMGIIRLGFMQDFFTWYQRATGGTPSTIFDLLTTVSVQVEKRGIEMAEAGLDLFKRNLAMVPRAVSNIAKRQNLKTGNGSYIVFGIQRAAFKAGIETTNLFMTGFSFFCLLVIFTVLSVTIFKGLCELMVRQKMMSNDKFLEFRNGWLVVLKGILFRVTLIGFPQMAILCLWELTQVDSPAEVVIGAMFFIGMALTLGWGSYKVISIARRSIMMHQNPAYILFSDPQVLNKWGFLYVQFRADAYYFIIPFLGYTLVKATLLAFSQRRSVVQAVGFLILEAAALICVSVMRPWMDKSTNSFNIAIYAVKFINAICVLIFSNVFGAPKLTIGVVGVFLFVLNAIFALVLLLMVLASTIFVFFRKNPDSRYQFMADDRTSFMKSQTQLTNTTELDALAATARGDGSKSGKHLSPGDNASMVSVGLQQTKRLD